MREFRRNDTIILKEESRPVGTIRGDEFRRQTEEKDLYWGVPLKYFEVEGDDVFLDARVATSLRWTVDGVMPDMLNIAALPDKVEMPEDEFSVNPGFWCSNIPKEQVK